jgi:hypothetical protein
MAKLILKRRFFLVLLFNAFWKKTGLLISPSGPINVYQTEV